jgi:hypothetical protein
LIYKFTYSAQAINGSERNKKVRMIEKERKKERKKKDRNKRKINNVSLKKNSLAFS